MKDDVLKCVIIGSGPAGYTAAIYAARADMNPVIYTGMEPGGQLTTTTEVENFPGYPEGVTGPELMNDLQKQAERFGTQIIYQEIEKVIFSDDIGGIHQLINSNGDTIKALSVIIATGASAKYLGIPCEEKYRGGGVSACATCDGFFYKGKPVAVVGGGDTAVEEATYLAKLTEKVYLIVRKDFLRASKAMQNRISNISNIEILYNYELKDLEGDGVVEKAIITNNISNEDKTIKVDGVFIAIGHQPNTKLFVNQLNMDDTGYLKVELGSTKTNKPGVFAAGDVADHIYRQAITAAGTGCMAALDAEKYLSSL